MTDDESLWSARPREELYDLRADPDEWHNLADAPGHAVTLGAMRRRLDDWMRDTADPLRDGPIARPTPAV